MISRIKSRRNGGENNALGAADTAAPSGSIDGGAGALIGRSGVSLDGQSLILPDDSLDNFNFGAPMMLDDDVSSINTSIYGGGRPINMLNDNNNFIDDEPSVLANEPVTLGGATGIPKNINGSRNHTNNHDDNHNNDNNNNSNSWMPMCFTGTSCLRKLFITSAGLLVISLILVFVAAGMASNQNNSNSNSNSSSNQNSNLDDIFPHTAPTEAPTTSNGTNYNETKGPTARLTSNPTPSPTLVSTTSSTTTPKPSDIDTTLAPTLPLTTEPFATPTVTPTMIPSMLPSSLPSLAPSFTSTPTKAPSKPPSTTETPTHPVSQRPTMLDNPNLQTFYLTAGRFAVFPNFQQQIASLPTEDDSAFMVHLGDFNSPELTSCNKQSYIDAYDLYSTSSVPVHFIVGDNEYNDCPNPDKALGFWKDYFQDYYLSFWEENKDIKVKRQNERSENWAFVQKRILFIGINLVGGRYQGLEEEWAERFLDNMEWINKIYKENSNKADAVVLFAHASHEIANVQPFYAILVPVIRDDISPVPFVIVNRNLGTQNAGAIRNFRDVPNLVVLVVKGTSWPTMRVQIDPVSERFSFDQDRWYEDQVLN